MYLENGNENPLLKEVERTRRAFFDSKASRYSDEYYKLLTSWDEAYSKLRSDSKIPDFDSPAIPVEKLPDATYKKHQETIILP